MRLNDVLIDVIFEADGVEFRGHRVVFAASSPYFKVRIAICDSMCCGVNHDRYNGECFGSAQLTTPKLTYLKHNSQA